MSHTAAYVDGLYKEMTPSNDITEAKSVKRKSSLRLFGDQIERNSRFQQIGSLKKVIMSAWGRK